MVLARGVVQLAGFDHVDDVDVGNVVQFAGAAFAHADDGQADVGDLGGAELLGRLGAGDGQGSLDGGTGQVGQFGSDRGHEVQRVGGAQVLDGQVHHPAAVGRPQRHVGFRSGEPRHRPRRLRVRPDGLQQRGPELVRVRGCSGSGLALTSKASRCSGCADEELAQRLGGAQDPVQRLAASPGRPPPASAGPGAFRSGGPGTAGQCPGSRPAAGRRTARPGPGPPVPRAARNRSPFSRSLKPAEMRRRARLTAAA